MVNSYKHIGFAQLNTNRSVTSMDLALASAAERDLQFILCTEPNKKTLKGSRWIADRKGDAAITRIGAKPDINRTGNGNGFVWIKVSGHYIYSCYISPNVSLTNFESFVGDLFDDIVRKMPADFLVTGDFNSKSPVWGSRLEDKRGEILGEMLATLGLTPLNKPGVPTFVRGNSRSIIDVTAVSDGLLGKVAGWKVLGDESLSPHRMITFELKSKLEAEKDVWIWGPINKIKLGDSLRRLVSGRKGATPDNLIKILKASYRETTTRIRTTKGKMPYWWTSDISELRVAVRSLRRGVLRKKDGHGSDAWVQYKEAKKRLCRAIKSSKRASWRQLLSDLDHDVHGEAYKIVCKRLKTGGPRVNLTRAEEKKQIDLLFPEAPVTPWQMEETVGIPPFTEEELKDAASRLKGGRAPGPDRIPPEVIKTAAESISKYMLEVYNGLLSRGSFPSIWKRSRVTLLEKPRKGEEQEAKYRPICLIDAAGKLYEALLNARITVILEDGNGRLSDNQHGFRKKHSTVSAVESVLSRAKNAHRRNNAWCLLTLVDVKNAFNTASWPAIVDALHRKGTPPYLCNTIKDYLTNRTIYTSTGVHRTYRVGVPQGSVLGPTLWNAMYDDIFRISLPVGVTLVGYADDIAVVAEHKAWDKVMENTKNALDRVDGWLKSRGLLMAPEKTEMVTLKYGRRKREGSIRVGGNEIGIAQSAKYLGVVLDTSVSFGPHIKAVASKAQITVTALSKIMPNIGGPSESKRRTLAAVGESILLYAAPVWAGVMAVASYRNTLQGVHRRLALRVCRGYRTVSHDATMVIAAMVPIHLLAEERRRLWKSGTHTVAQKRHERTKTLQLWQQEWDNSVKGRWTRRLIQQIEPWVRRDHGEVGYLLTQWLSGHGSFKTYKKRIGKSVTQDCSACGADDTAEHAVLECPSRRGIREQIAVRVGETITAENIISLMLRSKENWNMIADMITSVMIQKETEDRRE